jgi:hypothetical protein
MTIETYFWIQQVVAACQLVRSRSGKNGAHHSPQNFRAGILVSFFALSLSDAQGEVEGGQDGKCR